MKVCELIEQLQKLPQDIEVVMSKDGEGNNFSPLCDYNLGCYRPLSTWSGDWTSEAYFDDDPETYKLNAVCLWPTN